MKMPRICIEWTTRLCVVDGAHGYFHLWEPSNPVCAVVEFLDGVRRVDAEKVQFCDEINCGLSVLNRAQEEDALGAGRKNQGSG